MAITITTLNNEAAAAKTFVEVSKDRSSAEWYNSSDESSSFHNTISIKQRIQGKNLNDVSMRQTLVQCKSTGVSTSDPIVGKGLPEDIWINVTINSPTTLQALTSTQRKDVMAFLRNFLTAANVDALMTGQV